MATLVPTMALTSVDLPTLGRPTTATNPERTGFSPRWASRRRGPRRRRRCGRLSSASAVRAPVGSMRTRPMRRPRTSTAVRRKPSDLDRVAGIGHPPEQVEHQATDGVPGAVGQLGAEQLVGVVHRVARTHDHRPVLTALDRGLLHVELVDDVAHQLLEQVLERDQPRRAAVLVDDDGHVELLLLHLAQEVRDLLGLGYELGRPHDLAHRPVRPARPLGRAPGPWCRRCR